MSDLYTPQQIRAQFASCADQAQLERRLAALVNQFNADQKLTQQFKSIAGQVKGTLPIATVKESTTSGPKDRVLKATRPADLDPQIWAQWQTVPVKTAQGHLSSFRTKLIAHDSTGLNKSVHGEYRKGADGKEYFYPSIKVDAPSAPRVKITPEAEVSAYRSAGDKSTIELTSGAYDLLSRAERQVYAKHHIARLDAKKAEKKAAAAATKATDKASIAPAAAPVTTPVAPQAPVVIPAEIKITRGSLSFS